MEVEARWKLKLDGSGSSMEVEARWKLKLDRSGSGTPMEVEARWKWQWMTRLGHHTIRLIQGLTAIEWIPAYYTGINGPEVHE